MSRSKDEILDDLVNAKARRDALRTEYKRRRSEHELLEMQKSDLETQLKQLQAKLTGVSQEWNRTLFDARRIEALGKDCSTEVSQLERELSRLLDAERVKSELKKLYTQFKNSCLDAPWRGENRTDGLSAKSYQIDGAISIAVAKKAMLGDDMGLGKSLTALIACDLKDAKRVIIVCPSDTMHNFQRECILWTPHRFPVVLGQLPPFQREFVMTGLQESEHFMLIINYEAFRTEDGLLGKLRALKADTVIIDESHNIMNATTDATQNIHNLVFADNYCPNCYEPDIVHVKKTEGTVRCRNCQREGYKWEHTTVDKVIPISGTGILNKPQDLWAQLHIVDPQNFPNLNAYLWDFCQRNPHTNRWEWKSGGESRLVKIIGPRYIARSQEDAGIELPPKKPVEHLITREMFKEFWPKQYEAYEQARRFAQILLDPERRIAMSMPNKITALLRLRQVLVWPNAIELVDTDENGTKIPIARLDVMESCKVDKAEMIIRQCIEQGQRVVLFSQFTPGIHELQRRLGTRACVYDGSTNKNLKQAIQLDFDVKTAPKDGKHRWDVVLANYKSGGVGLNFNTASHVIRLDPPWNPGTGDQGDARARRIGSTAEEIQIHDIRVERSVDTWMAQILREKKDIIDGFDTQSDIYKRAFEALQDGEM